MMKKTASLYLLFVLLWLAVLVKFDWSAADIVNSSFMVGLIALLIAVSIKIMQSGFLALFFEGFQKIGQSMSVRSHAMERAEEQLKNDEALQEFKAKTGNLLFRGVAACSVVSLSLSMISLFFYY